MSDPDHVPQPHSRRSAPSSPPPPPAGLPVPAQPSRRSSSAPPGGPSAEADKDTVGWLFAQALAGEEAAELQLGRRAFGWTPAGAGRGAGGEADPEALRAYLALTRADYERHQDAPRPTLTPDQRAAADQRDARARDALLARVAPLLAVHRAGADVHADGGAESGVEGRAG